VAGTGLSWGYNGSGPVALAILLGLLLDDINAAAPRGYRYPQSPGLLVDAQKSGGPDVRSPAPTWRPHGMRAEPA
jgi:hypothetical protein